MPLSLLVSLTERTKDAKVCGLLIALNPPMTFNYSLAVRSEYANGWYWPIARIQRGHPTAVTAIKVADERQLRGQLPDSQDPAMTRQPVRIAVWPVAFLLLPFS